MITKEQADHLVGLAVEVENTAADRATANLDRRTDLDSYQRAAKANNQARAALYTAIEQLVQR